MVEVRLVDEDRDRDAEVVAQGRDALEVVTAEGVGSTTATARLAPESELMTGIPRPANRRK